MRERWNCTSIELPSFESATLPAGEDMIGDTRYIGLHKPMKNHDYILFTQDIMNSWADAMSLTTRSNSAKQLTTIGQDEALATHRPSPFFMNSSIDYTTCHSWWLNDSIYWDGLFSKTHHKPCLIQETGIMYVQNADGRPRRDEEELRNILERKYALAFAADNAGAIQWIWNINCYMDDINEVNIGAVRPDGSQKLEADVSYDFGKFMQHIAPMFENRKLEDVAVIFPFSSSFSARDSATASTQCAARILGYELNVPFRTFGEYQLSDLQAAKLIIMPSITCISENAFDSLLDLAESGSVVLISGVVSRDEYFINIPNRLEKLGFQTKVVNIQREEQLMIDNFSYRVPFGGNSYEWVDKEQVEIKDLQNKQCPGLQPCVQDALHIVPVGKGFLMWSPLPIELSENSEVVKAVYKKAIDIAKVQSTFEWISVKNDGVLLKKLSFDKGSLMIAVSESGYDSTVEVRDNESGVMYSFFLEAGRSVLFATDNAGHITSSYRDVLVTEKKS